MSRRSLLITIFIGVIITGVYEVSRCFLTEVCISSYIQTAVRKEYEVAAPNGTQIIVEVAETKAARELGLSGRETIGRRDGVLFVFPSEGQYGFWMKDMLFSIDMVWINKDGRIVYIVEDAKPADYPAVYKNENSALYVLELPSGRARELEMYLGSKLSLQ